MVLKFYDKFGDISSVEYDVVEVLFDPSENRFYFSFLDDKNNKIIRRTLDRSDEYYRFKVSL